MGIVIGTAVRSENLKLRNNSVKYFQRKTKKIFSEMKIVTFFEKFFNQ